MKNIEIILEDLVGLHILSGVEIGYVKEQKYDDQFEDCNYISFILDGKTYTAVENPSDGYRSCMSYIKIGGKKIKNIIPDTQVFGIMRPNSDYERYDIIQFYETKTAKLVLEIGTDNSDDYYPRYIAYFTPENLPCNQKSVDYPAKEKV